MGIFGDNIVNIDTSFRMNILPDFWLGRGRNMSLQLMGEVLLVVPLPQPFHSTQAGLDVPYDHHRLPKYEYRETWLRVCG